MKLTLDMTHDQLDLLILILKRANIDSIAQGRIYKPYIQLTDLYTDILVQLKRYQDLISLL